MSYTFYPPPRSICLVAALGWLFSPYGDSTVCGRPKSIKALEAAMESDRRVMLVAQRTAAKDDPVVSDMFDKGCISPSCRCSSCPMAPSRCW